MLLLVLSCSPSTLFPSTIDTIASTRDFWRASSSLLNAELRKSNAASTLCRSSLTCAFVTLSCFIHCFLLAVLVAMVLSRVLSPSPNAEFKRSNALSTLSRSSLTCTFEILPSFTRSTTLVLTSLRGLVTSLLCVTSSSSSFPAKPEKDFRSLFFLVRSNLDACSRSTIVFTVASCGRCFALELHFTVVSLPAALSFRSFSLSSFSLAAMEVTLTSGWRT